MNHHYNYSSYCQRPEEIDLSVYQFPHSTRNSAVTSPAAAAREQQFLHELRNLRADFGHHAASPPRNAPREVPIRLDSSSSAPFLHRQPSLNALHRTFSDSSVITTPYSRNGGREDPHWMTNPPPPFASRYNSLDRSRQQQQPGAERPAFFKCASPTPWQSVENLSVSERQPRQRFFSPEPEKKEPHRPRDYGSFPEKSRDYGSFSEYGRFPKEEAPRTENWNGMSTSYPAPPPLYKEEPWERNGTGFSRQDPWRQSEPPQRVYEPPRSIPDPPRREIPIERSYEAPRIPDPPKRQVDWRQSEPPSQPERRGPSSALLQELHQKVPEKNYEPRWKGFFSKPTESPGTAGFFSKPVETGGFFGNKSQPGGGVEASGGFFGNSGSLLDRAMQNREKRNSQIISPELEMDVMVTQSYGQQPQQRHSYAGTFSEYGRAPTYQPTPLGRLSEGVRDDFSRLLAEPEPSSVVSSPGPEMNLPFTPRQERSLPSSPVVLPPNPLSPPGSRNYDPLWELDTVYGMNSGENLRKPFYRKERVENSGPQLPQHSTVTTPMYGRGMLSETRAPERTLSPSWEQQRRQEPQRRPQEPQLRPQEYEEPLRKLQEWEQQRRPQEYDEPQRRPQEWEQQRRPQEWEEPQRRPHEWDQPQRRPQEPDKQAYRPQWERDEPRVVKHSGILLNPNESRRTNKRVMFVCDAEQQSPPSNRGHLISSPESSDAPAHIKAYDAAMEDVLSRFFALSDQIGGDVAAMGKKVQVIFDAHRHFLWQAASQAKPSAGELQKLFTPILKLHEDMSSFKESKRTSAQFNHLNAVVEGTPAFAWLTLEKNPAPHVKEYIEAAMFYLNRIFKEFKDKDQKHFDWAKTYKEVLETLHTFVRQTHTTGLVWNSAPGNAPQGAPKAAAPAGPSGGPPPPPPPPPADLFADVPKKAAPAGGDDRAALFAALNKGEAITSGLKKVTADMQTHKNPAIRGTAMVPAHVGAGASPASSPSKPAAAPIQRQPVIELKDGKQWNVEFHNGNKEIEVTVSDKKQSVYVYKCDNCVVKVNGKCNSVVLDSCKKTAIVVEALVAQCETVNCQSIQIQTMGEMPTLSIQKTDGCQVYLSEAAKDCEIVTSKSSEMNVLVPEGGDFVELPVPEQFKTVYKGGKLVTVASDI